MASVLHRTTKQYLTSVNTPDYPVEDWIIEPDLSAVVGFGSKYWTITGDVVTLMSQAERDAVDAAERDAQRDTIAAQLDQVEDIMRAFALTVLDEINLHASRITAILDAADAATSLATFKSAMASINDIPPRTVEQLKTVLRAKLGNGV